MTKKEKINLEKVILSMENMQKFMQKVKVEKRWRAGYVQALNEVKLKLQRI
jgi:hypothetical protein